LETMSGKKGERVYHKPKVSISKIASGILVVAGATAPLWVANGTGYSAISGVTSAAKREITPTQAASDIAFNLRGNLGDAAVTGAVFIGTGVAIAKLSSYAKRHGWIPRGMGL
jgi:hypothetical protein